jgi:protein TonB
MFETALVNDAKGARGALSFSTSLLLQAGLVTVGVAASLLVPIAMPAVPELNILPPAPKFKDAVKLVSSQQMSAAASSMQSPIRRAYIPNFTRDPVAVGSRRIEFGDNVPVVIGSGPRPSHEDVFGLDGIPKVAPPPPPKPPAKKEEPVVSRLAVGGNVLAAQILNRVQPIYPPIARQTRTEGVVQLHGVISREGRIVSLRVISGHPLLTKAALDAVSQWTYKPTYLNGQPIEVEAPIEVRFVLSR